VDVHLHEHPLPGKDRSYELLLPDRARVTLIVRGPDGRRELAATAPDRDSPDFTLALSEAQAVTLGMLLSGLVVTGHDAGEPAVLDQPVQVVTLELTADSPVLGRIPDGLDDEERARVLAVIRDDTPELVESDPSRVPEAGDRLVVAARPEELEAVRRRLGAR